jgi:predicted DNA-binding ribbon-helix-helix protein
MPNKPRQENRARPVRFEDGLWSVVQTIAAEDDTTTSEVVREAVRRYVRARKRRR